MAKPYSTSHIGFVSSGFTDMRLSGAVKEQLVEMLVAEIDRMVPAMEAATLEATPDKKTLDDTNRTRLNYNRTRELMIETEAQIKYEGYIKRQIEHVKKMKKQEHIKIPSDFNFKDMSSISNESKEKLDFIKPENLGQAMRISGIKPSDISILSVHLLKR